MIELTFNTRINAGIELLLADEVNPIIDFDGTRYLIDITKWNYGGIRWTPFNLSTQEIIGDRTYIYPFAAHNIFKDAIFGPSSMHYHEPVASTAFPSFPTPRDYGTVTP